MDTHERKKILHRLRQQPECSADADALPSRHDPRYGKPFKDWELLFKGSRTGSYLTIEECENGTVPVVIWEVTAADEAALDRYEGFPTFYYKRDIRLQYKGIRTGRRRTVTAFAYIMHEDRPIGIPSNLYMRTCLEGYDAFRFDKNILVDAYDKCREVCGYEG